MPHFHPLGDTGADLLQDSESTLVDAVACMGHVKCSAQHSIHQISLVHITFKACLELESGKFVSDVVQRALLLRFGLGAQADHGLKNRRSVNAQENLLTPEVTHLTVGLEPLSN